MEEFTLSSKSEGKYNEKGSTFSAIAIPVSSAAAIKNKLSEFPDFMKASDYSKIVTEGYKNYEEDIYFINDNFHIL